MRYLSLFEGKEEEGSNMRHAQRLSPPVKQLRPKSGRTIQDRCAKAGHSNILRSEGNERAKRCKNFAAQVLPDLQGKGLVRKEAFLLT